MEAALDHDIGRMSSLIRTKSTGIAYPTYTAPMSKKGEGNFLGMGTAWKHRIFTLSGNVLSWKDSNDEDELPKNKMHLGDPAFFKLWLLFTWFQSS